MLVVAVSRGPADTVLRDVAERYSTGFQHACCCLAASLTRRRDTVFLVLVPSTQLTESDETLKAAAAGDVILHVDL